MRQQVADLRVRHEGPSLYNDLIARIQLTLTSLKLLGLRTSMSETENKQTHEICHRIAITSAGRNIKMVWLELRYITGSDYVGCVHSENDPYNISIGLGPTKGIERLGFLSPDTSEILNPSETAAFLIQPMVALFDDE